MKNLKSISKLFFTGKPREKQYNVFSIMVDRQISPTDKEFLVCSPECLGDIVKADLSVVGFDKFTVKSVKSTNTSCDCCFRDFAKTL